MGIKYHIPSTDCCVLSAKQMCSGCQRTLEKRTIRLQHSKRYSTIKTAGDTPFLAEESRTALVRKAAPSTSSAGLQMAGVCFCNPKCVKSPASNRLPLQSQMMAASLFQHRNKGRGLKLQRVVHTIRGVGLQIRSSALWGYLQDTLAAQMFLN